ncbi:hypothetical protein ACJDU8_17430 [Clostridium sp. WILCCON 0269]|uniref:Uncharacterized protein n=1 Tax=Candidatus Clostridium eludens TaxID=3381663 RepID=A0ABW8SNT2_9CLOT
MFNQRYKAYLKATGVDPSKVRGYQYMIWLDGMWARFMEEKGIEDNLNLNKRYGSEFDDWLDKKFKNADNEMNYIDKKGNVIFVSAGLGMKEYGSFRRSEAGGLHRVKSPMMPMVSSREEAQENLNLWARKNGLKAVEEGEK